MTEGKNGKRVKEIERQGKLSRVLQCLVEWSEVWQSRVKQCSIEWSRVVKSQVECGGGEKQ